MNTDDLSSPLDDMKKNTTPRTALEYTLPLDTTYFEDENGVLKSEKEITNGLQSFYQKTGVQPYLIITDNLDGDKEPSKEALCAYAAEKYDALFNEQYHFLVIYVCNSDLDLSGDKYRVGYHIGDAATAVLDDEAIEFFEEYLKRFTFGFDFDPTDALNCSFIYTSSTIMSEPKTDSN